MGTVAVLLALTGLAIMLGPALPRLLGRARRPGRPGTAPVTVPALTDPHPTTARALAAATRLGVMLQGQGLERQASALGLAAKRLRLEEARGIYAMQQVLRHLRGVRLDDPDDQEIFEGLLGQLRRALSDRAEQLELLPRS